METLRTRTKRKALERRRLRAAAMFRKGTRQADIARKLGVTRAAVCIWHRTWEQEREEGLKSKGPPGTESRLTAQDRTQIKQVIRKGPRSVGYGTDYWTLARIADVIRKQTGVRYAANYVWFILRDLNISCQKPETYARERDEAAIRRWKEVTFPAIQKKGLA
jgi:transposase